MASSFSLIMVVDLVGIWRTSRVTLHKPFLPMRRASQAWLVWSLCDIKTEKVNLA
jgi:hypothetical protein